MTAALPLHGGCQCGALRYELAEAPLTLYACHCSNCQKQTGSAFVLSAIIPEQAFSFIQGAPAKVEWTADSGAKRYGMFCGDCGNRIANGQDGGPPFLSLRAGTFDDTSWVRPAGHIWTKSAQGWFKFAEDDLVCDTQPTDYGPYVERFRNFGTFPE